MLYNSDSSVRLSKKKSKFDKQKFDNAAKFVYENGGINPEDLTSETTKTLLAETNKILSETVPKGIAAAGVKYDVSDEILYALRENVFIFSGMKTYHQLKEASQLLITENGDIKPFYRFNEDIQKLYGAYNERYLEAEYGFALHSAQMAAKWNDYGHDGDTYNLQYRTAGDDRVRHDHAELNGITLAMSDPFWNSYTPPLDWGCRCTIIQVLKDKYPLSDSVAAQELGKSATTRIGADGVNKLAMFRFNPGKTLKIFPDKHPYFPRGCDNCDKNLQLAKNIDKNELCAVCAIVCKQAKKSATAQEREKYLKEMEPLLKKTVVKEVDGKNISIKFTKKGNRHLYSDTFIRTNSLKKEDLKHLYKALLQSKFVKSSEITKPRNDSIVRFYYFKDTERELFYNAAERIYKIKKVEHKEIFLYAATKMVKK